MGNGIVAQSEESITPNDTLPTSSLRQQILHIRFGWRFPFPVNKALYRVCYNRYIYKYMNKL